MSMLMVFFKDTATTEIYTLSLHDALPISCRRSTAGLRSRASDWPISRRTPTASRSSDRDRRSEEHTSELQSRQYLVCRLLLEKKTTHSAPAQTCLRNCCPYGRTTSFHSSS